MRKLDLVETATTIVPIGNSNVPTFPFPPLPFPPLSLYPNIEIMERNGYKQIQRQKLTKSLAVYYTYFTIKQGKVLQFQRKLIFPELSTIARKKCQMSATLVQRQREHHKKPGPVQICGLHPMLPTEAKITLFTLQSMTAPLLGHLLSYFKGLGYGYL